MKSMFYTNPGAAPLPDRFLAAGHISGTVIVQGWCQVKLETHTVR